MQRSVVKRFTNLKRCVQCLHQIQQKFCTKIATTSKSEGFINEKTHTGRLRLYLNNTKPSQLPKAEEVKIINLVKHKPTDLRSCATEDLLVAVNYLKSILTEDESKALLQILDLECCVRLPHLEKEQIFQILHGFLNAYPSRLITFKFYDHAVTKLYNEIDALRMDDVIQLMFFVGLQKKTENSRMILRQCIQRINQSDVENFTKEQMSIICNTSFKTSTKINSELVLEKINDCLNEDLSVISDEAVFADLIKSVRYNRYQSDDMLSTITCTVFFNKTYRFYSATTIAHIVALYSDSLHYDENILNLFCKQFINKLRETPFKKVGIYHDKQPRAKDIHRFLWSLSNLNYSLSKEDIENVIIPDILNRIKGGEFRNKPHLLIECVLYLWIMNYRPHTLLPHALTKRNVEFIRGTKTSSNQRMNLLLYVLQQEEPSLLKNTNLHVQKPWKDYDARFQLEKRCLLQEVFDTLQNQFEDKVDKFVLESQIPHINIIGIGGYKNGKRIVNIEVLDEYSSLKNTENKPTGLMDLKLRLLNSSHEGVIVIENHEVDDLTKDELKDLLLDDINLIC